MLNLIMVTFWFMLYGLGTAAMGGYAKKRGWFECYNDAPFAGLGVLFWPLTLAGLVLWWLIGRHWWSVCMLIYNKMQGR